MYQLHPHAWHHGSESEIRPVMMRGEPPFNQDWLPAGAEIDALLCLAQSFFAIMRKAINLNA